MNKYLIFISAVIEPVFRVAGVAAELLMPGAGAEIEKRLRGGVLSLSGKLKIDRHVLLNGAPRIYLGRGVKLHRGCQMVAGIHGSIKVGEGTHIGRNSVVSGHGNISIGRDCNISGLVAMYSVSNQPDGTIKKAPIVVGNSVNIGANVTLLPGITIGDHATVGAGAVVTKDVEAYDVVIGVPARVR